MTFNPFGYSIPQDQVHALRAEWYASHPNQINQQPVMQLIPQPVLPLQLGQIPVVLAQHQEYQQRPNLLGRAVVGAIAGAMVGRWLSKRRARKAQETAELKRRLGVTE